MKKVYQVWAYVATGYDSDAMQPVKEFSSLAEAEKAIKEDVTIVSNKHGRDTFVWLGHSLSSVRSGFSVIEAYVLNEKK